jgi:hypothetical protein
MMKKLLPISLLAISVVFIGASCQTFTRSSQSQNPSTSQGGFLQFTSQDGHYSIEVPRSWYIQDTALPEDVDFIAAADKEDLNASPHFSGPKGAKTIVHHYDLHNDENFSRFGLILDGHSTLTYQRLLSGQPLNEAVYLDTSSSEPVDVPDALQTATRIYKDRLQTDQYRVITTAAKVDEWTVVIVESIIAPGPENVAQKDAALQIHRSLQPTTPAPEALALQKERNADGSIVLTNTERHVRITLPKGWRYANTAKQWENETVLFSFETTNREGETTIAEGRGSIVALEETPAKNSLAEHVQKNLNSQRYVDYEREKPDLGEMIVVTQRHFATIQLQGAQAKIAETLYTQGAFEQYNTELFMQLNAKEYFVIQINNPNPSAQNPEWLRGEIDSIVKSVSIQQ